MQQGSRSANLGNLKTDKARVLRARPPSLHQDFEMTKRMISTWVFISATSCLCYSRQPQNGVQPKCSTKLPLPGTGAQVQEFAIGPEALATGVVEANLRFTGLVSQH